MRTGLVILALTLTLATAASAQKTEPVASHKAAAVELLSIMKVSDALGADMLATQKMLTPHMPELQKRIMARIGGGSAGQ